MAFYREFTGVPGTTREEVAEQIPRQHDAGANTPERQWLVQPGGRWGRAS